MNRLNQNDILGYDKHHIWHPYTSMINPLPVYHVVSASGVRLKLSSGQELIDGMSSWWAAIHGYNVPELNEACRDQLHMMAHVMFGGLTHDPAVKLASLLVDITPDPLETIFFSDSGSVAVEVAMKMAIQYWHSLDQPQKNKFLTIRSGYHGDTFHAMSVTDPVTGMHQLFKGVLPEYFFADSPACKYGMKWDERDLDSFTHLMGSNRNELAAVILEPIVQGAGGMCFYSPEYLKGVRDLCDKYEVLLIADEIATGFGRTGKMFACEHAGISPDIMCVGKALTGGYMTLAATLTTCEVSHGLSSKGSGVFMHGPTFMANPLACKVAQASVSLLLSSKWKERVAKIEKQMRQQLVFCDTIKHVVEVRVLGAIGVVELKHPVNLPLMQNRFVEKGVWIRPFGKLVYIMPPYIISENDLNKLVSSIIEVVRDNDVLLK